MPNRILRESINDSEAVDRLAPQEEVFYRRLMSVVDDFGRFDARPAILRSRCYPLKQAVRETDITRWLAACETAGLIALYSVDSRQYLLFHKLGEPRATSSKYPAPPDTSLCAQDQAAARSCAQAPPYSYSDSLSNSDTVPPQAADVSAKRFVAPTVEEVQAYCRERKNTIDPQRFIDHYSSNGWRVGKNAMKDWKAAVRTWEKNDFGGPSKPAKPSESAQQALARTQAEQAKLEAREAELFGRVPT